MGKDGVLLGFILIPLRTHLEDGSPRMEVFFYGTKS